MENINFALLTQDELFDLVRRMLNRTTEANSETLNLIQVNDVIGNILNRYQEGMMKDRKSAFTAVLSNKDQLRDNSFLSFRYKMKSDIYNSSPDVAEAATRLMEVIRKHGYSLHRKGYRTQTTKMTQLVEELEQEPASGWVTTTTAGGHVATMKSTNTDFEAKSKENVDADLEEDVPAAVEVRKELETQTRTALEMLQGNYNFMGGDELKNLLDALNEEISLVMSIARARATRNENNKEDENLEA